ncbi:flavodoxin family protein [Aquimarina sp. AD10]|uniref:NAD(P)H-dependent oxidoreductase n=1 Tax=Aquimarina sp. AD10 TaxID=1714849 RepID=UPI000E49F0A5|nr:NAD(P)H-dependent oxidoreductase [Aquimarina sp. AD10]AXT59188.1 flavodoxin family protein [Aquimarina sp. AD10]RKM93895.1 flavodoxin family protein [Aquimarina sp. AD10]
MKKTILIINAHQKYDGISEGKLNKAFVDTATAYLKENKFNVIHTHTEQPYSIDDELQKLVKADFIIFQSPIYWFGVPWITKKYFDEVWSAGYTTVTCSGDGRTREDPSRRYGTGGLMNDKSYMLSLTYASPKIEFDDTNGFYDGKSIDDANIGTHKIFQFCGLQMLQTYAIYNVHKEENLNLEKELEIFRKTLKANFLSN